MSSATITHTELVSGPSPLLAFLRALHLKIAGAIRSAWSHMRTVLNTTLRVPGSIATAITSLLSSKTGYATVTGAIRGFCRWIWRGITKVARLIGQLAETATKALIIAVGHVSPSAADALYAGLVSAKVTVTRIAAHIDHVIRTAGEVMWMLLNTAFVRAVSTTAAGIAAGFLVVHEATSGALFEWIVRLTPKAVGWVAWITNPWWCLAGVVASTGLAMILAFLRLLKSADASSHDPDGDGPDQPASAVDWSEWQQSIGGDALDSLVDQLHVSVAPNGSVTVSGIPDWVPTDLRRPLAKVASDAAIRQWERTARHRPTPSRDDRRLFTKAARDAVRQFGSSRSQRPRSAA